MDPPPLHLLLIILRLLQSDGVAGYLADTRGPRLTIEPPSLLQFSNSSGGRADCAAEGSPAPRVEWVLGADGSPVGPVPGARIVMANGSLLFPPFRGDHYRPDVHSATYRCAASNSAGRVLSLDVQVRAVVVQEYEARVYDSQVLPGNTAVFRCHVPSFVRDFLTVTSWLQDHSFNIYPTTEGDAKHVMLPSGELHVISVDATDSRSSYRCRTLHRLTGRTQESATAGRILLAEPKGPVAPRLTDKSQPVISGRRGEDVVLPCVAQGYPPPKYWWFRKNEADVVEHMHMSIGERRSLLGGSLLLRGIQTEDASVYSCVANSSAGSVSQDIRVRVLPELTAHIVPASLQVDSGAPAEFLCVTLAQHVVWLKDGQRVLRVGEEDGARLTISEVQREDQGMYQCIASCEGESVQATAELRLGASRPQLLYRFIEQTLQPGPDVSLKCIAAGQPTPQIYWRLDGFPLPQNDRFVIGQYVTVAGDVISHVNISKVAVEDGGTYECTAENRVGRTSHKAPLRIYGFPIIRKMPPISAVAGELLIVTCPAAGYPIHTITWEKEGRALPVNHRQTVHPNGTLMVRNVQQRADQGTYTCQARNRQGQSDRGSVDITVMEPPSIYPFSIESGVRLGERLGLQCLVTKGDPPLTIHWLKDEDEVLSLELPALTVTSLGEFSSTLLIEQLSTAHGGRYTCQASNRAATTSHSAVLAVNVPPEWVIEPKDTSVIAGQTVALHCQADGFPQPTISWRKGQGKQATQYDTLEGPLKNGTLIIPNVKEEDEGFYMCEANNGIGASLSAVVFLKVNALPRFVLPLRHETVKRGETATFLCEAEGDLPMQIIWRRNGARITHDTNRRFHLKESSLDTSAVSQLTIHHATTEDSGKYVCIASNPFGKDETVVQLSVQDVPEPPTDLRVVECRSREVKLAWNEPPDGNSPITHYSVVSTQDLDRWPDTNVEFGHERQQMPPEPWMRIKNLHPATTYYFRVIAHNQLGAGSPSHPVSITSEPEKPSGPPRNLVVAALSPTSVQATWDAPDPKEHNGPIIGYYVGYMQLGMGTEDRYNYTTVTEEDSLTWILDGLQSYTKYKVVVQAFNNVGPGPPSPGVVVTTAEAAPSASPQDIRCGSSTARSLHLSWSPPPLSARNGVITRYHIKYKSLCKPSDFRSIDNAAETEVSQLTTVLMDLEKYCNYSIQLAAMTSVGVGPWSDHFVCLTAEDVPEAPAAARVALSSPRLAVIGWAPPSRSNGVLKKYNVYEREIRNGLPKDPVRHTVLPPTTYYEAGQLREKSSYEWWVTAVTRVGEGPSTPVMGLSPSSRVPAAILSFPITVSAPWKTDVAFHCRVVGNPRPDVHWTFNGNNIQMGRQMNTLPNGTLIIKNLSLLNAGNYSCNVRNIHHGESVIHTLRVLVPPSPPKLELVAAGWNNITLQWSAQSESGMLDLKGYILHYRPVETGKGDWTEKQLPWHTQSQTISHLKCGTQYQFTIAARNLVGVGEQSSILQVQTLGDEPRAPPTPHAVSSSPHALTLHLERWNNGGCPITHFVLERRTTEQNWSIVTEHAPPMASYTISGLEPATFYNLRVTAHNEKGPTVTIIKASTLTAKGGVNVGLDDVSLEAGPVEQQFYMYLRVSLPISVSILALILTFTTVAVCLKRKPAACTEVNLPPDDGAVPIKSEYYSVLQTTNSKQPECEPQLSGAVIATDDMHDYDDDIYPYATFQAWKPVGQVSSQRGFQTFVYQGSDSPGVNSYATRDIEGDYSHVRPPLRSDTEDYDSPGSDSDARIEDKPVNLQSSYLHSNIRHSRLVSMLESSTSNEASPTPDRRIQPNKSRMKSHSPKKKFSIKVGGETKETAFTFPSATPNRTPTRTPSQLRNEELSEAECDRGSPFRTPLHYRV